MERDSGIFSKINKLSFQKLGKIQPQYIKLRYFATIRILYEEPLEHFNRYSIPYPRRFQNITTVFRNILVGGIGK